MKSSKFLVCVIAFCMIGLACNAQANEKLSVADMGSGTFKVIYKSNDAGPVKVSITNSKGDMVFTETLQTTSFMRPYNFSDQGPGEYKITIDDKAGKTEKTIMYSIKKVESKIDVSKIANAQSKYLLSVENNGSDQIQIKIMDGDKNLIHEESLIVNGKSSIVFNLKVNKSPIFEVAGSDGAWKTFTF